MKILQVTPLYYPSLGGVQNHVKAISESLAKLGHHVTVATLTHERHLPKREFIEDIEVRRFGGVGPEPYRIPYGLLGFLLTQGSKYNVIHAHNYGNLPLLWASAAWGKRAVITLHYHGQSQTAFARLLHRIYDPVATAALRRVRHIVCVSSAEARLVAANLGFPQKTISIIPNIVPLANEHPASTKHEDHHSRYLLLSVGRLVSYKGVGRIIEALSHLPDEFALCIVGDGPERGKFENLARRKGVEGRTRFMGSVADKKLWKLYTQAAIVVSLSESEAFGRIVVEGLAHGCRVVCSEIPAFMDFAREFPGAITLVADGLSSEGIAEVIKAAAAREVAGPFDLTRFGRKEVATELVKLYGMVANSGTNHPLVDGEGLPTH